MSVPTLQFYSIPSAIVFLALFVNSVNAQVSTQATENLEVCKTSFSEEGELPTNYYSMVYSPHAFDKVIVEGDAVYAFDDDLHSSRTALVFGKDLPSSTNSNQGRYMNNFPTVLVFQRDGVAVHKCKVNVRPFNENLDGANRLAFGECGLPVRAGMPDLILGHMQVIGLPESAIETTSAPPSTLDFSTLDNQRIVLFGKAEGIGQLVWIDETVSVGGICPIFVHAPRGQLDDDNLCRDVNGDPLRLAIGETATVEFDWASDELPKDLWWGDYEHTVAEVSMLGSAAHVFARAAGTTSILNFQGTGERAEICAVEVTPD